MPLKMAHYFCCVESSKDIKIDIYPLQLSVLHSMVQSFIGFDGLDFVSSHYQIIYFIFILEGED